LQAWRRDYPPDVFGNVWSKLSDLATSEVLIAPEEVLLELQRREDEVYRWAKAHDSMFLPPEPAVEDQVNTIVNRWPNFLPEDSQDGVWADPYVIALAAARQAVVVTAEILASANARRPKIPNICDSLSIPWTQLLGLLRSQGCKF